MRDLDLPVGYHFGVSAHTGAFADDHDLHSINVYEIVSAGSAASEPVAEAPKVSEDVQKKFEEVQLKVQGLRHDHDVRETTHDSATDTHLSGIDSADISRLHESLFSIMDNVRDLRIQFDKFADTPRTDSPAGSASPVADKQLHTQVTTMRDELSHLRSEFDKSFALLKDIATFVTHIGTTQQQEDKQHIAKQLQDLHYTLKQSNSKNAGSVQDDAIGAGYHFGWTINILIFLMGQGLLLALYTVWKQRSVPQEKKFI
eukprot:Partr_v1_DN26719_c0_g1_i2_m8988